MNGQRRCESCGRFMKWVIYPKDVFGPADQWECSNSECWEPVDITW